ncbi:MAG: glycosyltransferase family 39 protein [Prolixibacteraceae bacterium]|nr:glycosyltransferase family 39 protein [Prolixibacteraceae bacterium]
MPYNLNIKNILRYGLYLLAVLPIFIFRDYTPDNELRYLSIADEALRNGNIFTFTNHGLIYADKPPLYLWIVMFGKVLFGSHNLLFLGLFSLIPALVIVYIMDNWVKDRLTESERFAGQLMLLTSGFFIGTAVVMRMDMLMCMFIVLSLNTFYRIYTGNTTKWDTYLFPIYVFMALFSKGPIGIIVPLISTVVFLFLKRDMKSIGKYWGWKTLAILLILCGIWFSGVYAEGGDAYLNNLLFKQTVNRAVNSFHHQEPFYFYLIAFWYSLAPWSLLIAGIFIAGVRKKLASSDLELFFLTISASTLVTLSLFSSKLPVYMLPAFPFFVYLAVLWLKQIGYRKWIRPLALFPAIILCLTLPAIFVAPHFISTIESATHPMVIVAALILTASGIVGIKQLYQSKITQAIQVMGGGMLAGVFAISFAIPQYNSIIGLKELCEHAQEVATKQGAENYYYCEMSRGDNLDVYLGVKPGKLLIKDLYDTNKIKRPAVLFLWQKAIDRNDSIQTFIKNRPMYRSGSYYYFEIE